MNQKSNMHVAGESDGRTVPTKCPNKNGKPLAEGMEGRRPTKENIEQTTASQTQSWVNASSGLLGVDRKSTRLNSSHDQISYAVFCLKKKNCTPVNTAPSHKSSYSPIKENSWCRD